MGTAASAEAVPCLRRFVHGTATRWALPAKTIDTLSLVVTELITDGHAACRRGLDLVDVS